MEITVKRRTWFLVGLMPVSLKFNGQTIGSVGGFQKKTLPIPKETGILTCGQTLDHTDRMQIKE